MKELQSGIESLWENRSSLDWHQDRGACLLVEEVIEGLDRGDLRVVEQDCHGGWQVCEWLKKGILLSFSFYSMKVKRGYWYDKIPLKVEDWEERNFKRMGVRMVPGSIVRKGSFVESGAILMPCFINVGAWVGRGSMIDTWSTVGSCAYVGRGCHISGGVGLGGVLEPLQSRPVIIEDECFIGARSEIAEGVIVGKGSVIAMGVMLGASTKIIHRETGEIFQGCVPPFSVIVPGAFKDRRCEGVSLGAAVIVKTVDEGTRKKTSINDLLRDI